MGNRVRIRKHAVKDTYQDGYEAGVLAATEKAIYKATDRSLFVQVEDATALLDKGHINILVTRVGRDTLQLDTPGIDLHGPSTFALMEGDTLRVSVPLPKDLGVT